MNAATSSAIRQKVAELERTTQASIKLATTARAILRELCPSESNEAFLSGVQSARDMLKNIQRTVEIQVDEDGDFNIAAIAGLIHAYLPVPGPGRDEASGFSVVLAEYLANIAGGCVLDCDFEPSCLGDFLGDEESGVAK